MTVYIYVSRTQQHRGWCPFWQSFCARVQVHTACACVRCLIIYGYFFQTICYALLCMIYSTTSQAFFSSLFFFFLLNSSFEKKRVLGSWGHNGKPASARCCSSFSAFAFYYSAQQLLVKVRMCKISAGKCHLCFCYYNFLIKMNSEIRARSPPFT